MFVISTIRMRCTFNISVIYPNYILSFLSVVCNYLFMPSVHMMTSLNGNIFRVTGPLCGEFTGPGEFPTQRPVTRSFDVFFDLRLNKRLSKQPWGWWFETPSWSLWRHRNERWFDWIDGLIIYSILLCECIYISMTRPQCWLSHSPLEKKAHVINNPEMSGLEINFRKLTGNKQTNVCGHYWLRRPQQIPINLFGIQCGIRECYHVSYRTTCKLVPVKGNWWHALVTQIILGL